MPIRQKLAAWLDRPAVQNTIFAVILFNAVLLGMETSATIMERAGPLIVTLDRICLAIFVAEIAAKLFARGPRYLAGSREIALWFGS